MKKDLSNKSNKEKNNESKELLIKEVNSFLIKKKPLTEYFLKKLISIKTVNPPGNERKAVEFIKRMFKKHKIKFSEFEKEKNRTNLVVFLGSRKKNALKILIAAHLDTVPAGNNWKTNPFKAVKKGNKIIGRGAEDDKSAVAAAITLGLAFKKIEASLIKENKEVILGFFADEEQGSKKGIKFMLKEKKLKADYAIVPDIGKPLNLIDVGEKAVLFLELKFTGKQAHGSRPNEGINALLLMNELINKLKKIRIEEKPLKCFSKATINFGVIKAGNAPNIVPAECILKIDLRFSRNNTRKKIIKKINLIGEKIAVNNKGKFYLKELGFMSSFKAEENNELIKALKNSIKKELKLKPKTICLNGTTVAKNLNLNKIKAVGFGIGRGQAHKSNEFIEFNQLIKWQKIITGTVIRL